ncbi:MAG: tRNA dihydrouridine synthase DusB, partial [Alphaproteobacteria bacterium]|nr:tRNA dihydrouridine synthase DusB [Alphaproteobacteria bacterium]
IARKHISWYTKGLPRSAEFRAIINQMSEPVQVINTIHEFYQPQLQAGSA